MKDGVLLVNKPSGFTSFDVIAKLRGILKERKLGHGGTLDPNVTGILPVFVKKATRACDICPVQDKKYTASFRLGISTDTQDIWGKVVSQKEPERDIEKIKQTILSFIGNQKQLPPMYSAIKVNGKRLYDLAREGIEVERQARDITVYEINFLGKIAEDEYEFDIFCSKGSYVRTICNDIGEKLGCGAAMTSLERTSALGFDLENAHSLDEIQKASDDGEIDKWILPIESVFKPYPQIILNEKQTKMYKNGVALSPDRVFGIGEDELYRVFGFDKNFIGLGKLNREKEEFKTYKMFLGE